MMSVIRLRLNFRFVNGFPDVKTAWSISFAMHSVHKEEKYLATYFSFSNRKSNLRIHNHLFITIWLILIFFSRDFYHRIFLSANLPGKNLIRSGDNFVEREMYFTNKVMLGPISYILKIVDVVNCDFKLLLLLEFVWHIEALDPLRTQIIHYYLCHADHWPHISFFLM